jgi:hypothetical protein
MLITTIIYSGGTFMDIIYDWEDPNITIVEEDSNKSYFVFLNAGMSSFGVDSELEPNHSFNSGALDDSSTSFELGFGYNINKDVFATMSFQKSMLDIADISNLELSINYQFSNLAINAKPFVGFLIGKSTLKWSKEPHVVKFDKDLTSKSPVYGIQAGIKKRLVKDWYIVGMYKLMFYNHEMDIRNQKSIIEHNSEQNLFLGVQYEF